MITHNILFEDEIKNCLNYHKYMDSRSYENIFFLGTRERVHINPKTILGSE